MGILDLVSNLQHLAENPDLEKAAHALATAAVDIPNKLASIEKLLQASLRIQMAQFDQLLAVDRNICAGNGILQEISLGLDALNDPVKRPPFHATDVEAAMRGQWPPDLEGTTLDYGDGAGPDGVPLDCTNYDPQKGKPHAARR